MLYALATPGSAFKPAVKKMPSSWRLEKFKTMYREKGGVNSRRNSIAATMASLRYSIFFE